MKRPSRRTWWIIMAILFWVPLPFLMIWVYREASQQPDVTMSYPEYLFWTTMAMLMLCRVGVFIYQGGKIFFQVVKDARERRAG